MINFQILSFLGASEIFAPLQNTQDEVFDKKSKNIKEKKHYNTVIKRHYIARKFMELTPSYTIFQEMITTFGNKKQYQEIVNIVTPCETARKHS